MSKYINADDFLLQYSIMTQRPEFTPLSSEMAAWKLWKAEFDRNVQLLVSRMVTEKADEEEKVVAKIKEIPVLPVPAADVVEVVRCRDCKHLAGWDESHPHDFIYKCDRRIIENKVLLDDFCSYGERKERKVKKCFDIPTEVAKRLLEDMERKESDD